MRVLFTVVLGATLLVGCGGGAAASQSVLTASSACSFAFQVAIRGNDVVEAIEDLNASFGTCQSVAEWTAAFDSFNGVGLGRPAAEVLAEACALPANATKPVCVEAAP